MRNKMVAIVLLVAVVVIAWFCTLSTGRVDTGRIEELVVQINANTEVKTYKNSLPLYQELISIDPGNIDWYTGLANTYQKLNQISNYEAVCNSIVSSFPESPTGYAMLLELYDSMGEVEAVLTTYANAPDNVKSDAAILGVYEKNEWAYKFVGGVFHSVSNFSTNTYVVSDGGKQGYLGASCSGKPSLRFDIARPFINGYAAVCVDGEWFFVDGAGDRVLATKEKIEDLYSFAGDFAVAKIGGKYGYVDIAFGMHHFDYEDATSFFNGVAAVKQNGKWGLINTEFQNITEFIYDDVIRDDANICSRRGVVFLLKDGKYHMLSHEGEYLTTQQFDGACVFYSNYGAVKLGEKWGFIDRNGNTVIDFRYDDASSFASGLAAVCVAGQWGCIDLEGNTILDFDYEHMMITAENGILAVKIGDTYRFLKFIKYG